MSRCVVNDDMLSKREGRDPTQVMWWRNIFLSKQREVRRMRKRLQSALRRSAVDFLADIDLQAGCFVL